MKTKKFLVSGILGIALSGFVLTGCHKTSTAPDTDITAAQDEASGQYVSTDAKGVSDNAIQASGHARLKGLHGPIYLTDYSSVASVILDTVGTTVSVTINFGTTPVECKDFKWREGEIIVSWPVTAGTWWAAYFTYNTQITQTFSGYKVGNYSYQMNEVAGTRTWTNEGHDTLGYQNWNFTANLTITRYTGKTFTWTSTRNNALVYESAINGGTWFYEVTGSAKGTTESGVVYSLNIASPLYVTAWPWWLGGCPYIESGILNITRSTSTNTLSINFGTLGSCAGVAVATLNGNTYNIYGL